MPSIEALGEVVRIARALLFPGYFGDAVINEQTLLYHIGIHVERLQGLLIRQIKSGLCFDGTLSCNDGLESTARRKAAAIDHYLRSPEKIPLHFPSRRKQPEIKLGKSLFFTRTGVDKIQKRIIIIRETDIYFDIYFKTGFSAHHGQ